MKRERYISDQYLKSQQKLHQHPKGYGGRGDKWALIIADLLQQYNCSSLLDYGCGQGSLVRALEKLMPKVIYSEYDPAIKGKDEIEKYKLFDMVVCTDVLEHVEPDKLGVVIDHIFRLTIKVAFIVVATRPSNKWFPNGQNVHLTIEPASWWRDRIEHPSFILETPPPSPETAREYVVLAARK